MLIRWLFYMNLAHSCILISVIVTPVNGISKYIIFTCSIARSASRRYLIYSEADFKVFHPTAATRCTDGGEICGPLLHAKFHPHRCSDKGVGSPKLKFLLRFHQNVEYKRPAGAYPLSDFFYKICRVCNQLQDALAVKMWLDLLEALWSYGVLS